MDDIEDDRFSDEEKELIKPYFTNLDRHVFALTNLPEVVKGALFSRYSRSTKSLRMVLLDEFILKPEMGFKEIVNQNINTQFIAINKAEEFYDRVLIGYGDDSVAELGGANIACEQISQLSAKFIENTRIGLSPLEKSTRYVWFNNKAKGKYQYYREPRLLNSEFAELYIETCDMLFDTYSKLINPMIKFFTERHPNNDGISERAYNSAIRSKACDSLRFFLPASTLTNLGVCGNGRAFEYLLTKMYAHPLTEIRNLAESIHKELNIVLPSFVKRANDKYGKSAQEYISETHIAVNNFVRENLNIAVTDKSEDVILIHYDKDAELKVLSAILYPHMQIPLFQIKEIVNDMSRELKTKLIDEYLSRRQNRRHRPGRALENSYYWFDILTNYGAYRDLQRHRILTQEAQNLTVNHGYDTPTELIDAGYSDEYHECMNSVKEAFNRIYPKYPKEAEYVVAFGYRIRWYICLNLRELCHLTELRSIQQGHQDYRNIAQKIYLKVKEVHPLLAGHIKFVDMKDYALERLEAEKKLDKKIAQFGKGLY